MNQPIHIEYYEDDYGDLDDVVLTVDDFDLIVEQGLLKNVDFFKSIAENIYSVKRRHSTDKKNIDVIQND